MVLIDNVLQRTPHSAGVSARGSSAGFLGGDPLQVETNVFFQEVYRVRVTVRQVDMGV
jgi:hypothetical protein